MDDLTRIKNLDPIVLGQVQTATLGVIGAVGNGLSSPSRDPLMPGIQHGVIGMTGNGLAGPTRDPQNSEIQHGVIGMGGNGLPSSSRGQDFRHGMIGAAGSGLAGPGAQGLTGSHASRLEGKGSGWSR